MEHTLPSTQGELKARYEKLVTTRNPYLARARECAVLTIPALIPPEGSTGSTYLPTPYQALGARGVNNLASKLLITLLPPSTSFFKLVVDDFMLEQMTGQKGLRAMVEEAFNSMERAVMTEIETSAIRPSIFEGLKHLLVSGNILFFLNPQGGMKVFPLDRYVCRRDPMGKLLEIITKENVSEFDLPEGFKETITSDSTSNSNAPDGNYELYTTVKREFNRWVIYQEVGGKEVPESHGTYPLDKSPWLALRFVAIAGESYGRGFCEEYLGDLKSLEGLTKSIVQASAAAAKVLFLMKPNSVTSEDDITDKESGSIITGNIDDVGVLQLNKQADLQVAAQTIQRLESSLGFAFLLNTSIQRNGERVTAEEIRFMADELENALGGIYSTLSQEFQLPLVTVLMNRMERQKKLPILPKGIVKPQVTTGVEAIGRGQDMQKLNGWLQAISVLGPDVVAQNVNANDYIKRTGVALGIDMKGLMKTPEEIAASNKQNQQMAMVQKLGPAGINQMGGIAKEQLKQDSQETDETET